MLLEGALERPAGERGAFINAACAGDQSLQHEVESLIASHQDARSFLEAPALAGSKDADPLVGRTLGAYRILSRLGAGGMGEVFLAQDSRLGRKVALKFLPEAVSGDPDRLRRFRQEALVASALNHPNILVIHEIGEVDARHFIATEYVEGETLRERMARERLEVSEAVEVVRQVASGLAAAHAAGIVHRDVKPENIMLRRDGYVKLLDFGLAKPIASHEIPVDTEAETLVETTPGILIGTVAYMSPEHVRGGPVDRRSDIFSLGAVLYELLSGRRAFDRESPAETMAAILRDEPPPLLEADRKPGLEPIVRRCLEKRPADRFQSAEDLASALRRSLDAADAAPTPGVPSLAVLPFASPAGEVDQQLGFGMADALITRLGNIRRILVRPTSAIRRYLTSAPDPAVAGRELRVDTVLEGCIQRSGEKLRVTVQLIDVQTGAPIWGEGFDESLADIFHVQDSISERLAASLVSSLTAAEKEHLQKRYTQNLDAYQSYLKGRYHWNKRTKEGLAKAVEYLSEAVRQDTGYALAHSALADCYTLLASAGYDVGDRSAALASARAAATKAIEIDSQMAEAHTSLGLVKFRGDWDWVGAEKEFRRAIELKPGDASAHHFCGLLLCAMGRQTEAIAAVKRAYELDPLSLIIGCAVGRVWHFGREYDRAIEQFRRVLEMDPSFAEAHFGLGVALLQETMFDDARNELEEALRLSGGRLLNLAFLGYLHAVSGNRTEAERILKQLGQLVDEGRISPFYQVTTWIGLGQEERVFPILERAFQEREGLLAFARVEPIWDSLRSDARFETMLRHAGLRPPS